MGYDRELVIQALRHFRDEAKYKRREYNDEGEVGKAMDWINDYQKRQKEREQEQVMAAVREAERQEEEKKKPKRKDESKQEMERLKKKAAPKYKDTVFNIHSKDTTFLFAWGKAIQGQLGIGKDTDFVFAPTMIDLPTQGMQVKKIACGANHTDMLTEQG